MIGKVKWFDAKKGFGFITPDGGGPEAFVHYQNIEGAGFKKLEEGDRVSFETLANAKGLKATNVRVLTPETSHPAR